MAENDATGEDEAGKGKASRGAFPRIGLRRTLELAETIFKLGDGDSVRRRSVFDKLGRSADSGPSRMLVTTSNGYRLTTGAYNAEHLSLTDLGKEIVSTNDSALKLKLAHDALFANALFAAFVIRFNDKPINNDEIGIDYLRADHKMSEDDAKVALTVFKENLHDYSLTKDYSGKTVVLNRQSAVEEFLKHHPQDDVHSNKKPEPETFNNSVNKPLPNGPKDHRSVKIDATNVSEQSTLPVLNLKLRLPENATAEIYEAIFASMAKHLYGRNIGDSSSGATDANNAS